MNKNKIGTGILLVLVSVCCIAGGMYFSKPEREVEELDMITVQLKLPRETYYGVLKPQGNYMGLDEDVD